jgi:transcriptional regulator with XRE-family HTH domain
MAHLLLNPKNVRVRLAEMEMTQGELAFAAGISPWELSRLMKGHTQLDEAAAKSLAAQLNCEVEYIADLYIKAP